jgi:hypothetical protein
MKLTDEPIPDSEESAAAPAAQDPTEMTGGPMFPQVQLLTDGKTGKTLLAPMGGTTFHQNVVLACLPGLMQEAFAKTHTEWDVAIEHAFTIADKVVARYGGK